MSGYCYESGFPDLVEEMCEGLREDESLCSVKWKMGLQTSRVGGIGEASKGRSFRGKGP